MRTIEKRPFEYPFSCKKCPSSYVAEAKDICLGHFGGTGYAGEPGTPRFYVPCPSCGEYHLIENNQVPPKVQEIARRKNSR